MMRCKGGCSRLWIRATKLALVTMLLVETWGCAAPTDAGISDAGPCDPTLVPVASAINTGPYFRVETRAYRSGSPVADVLVVVDHVGKRVEGRTDEFGVATFEAPRWNEGPVDVTVLDPGGLGSPRLTSFLGVARTDTLSLRVHRPRPVTRTLAVTITDKLIPTDQVLIGSVDGSSMFQGTDPVASLTVWQPSLRLVGTEFAVQATVPGEIQKFFKWFEFSIDNTRKPATLSVRAATRIASAIVHGSLKVPGGATGPFANVSPYLYVRGPESDFGAVGVPLGYPTIVGRSGDGATATFAAEVVSDPTPFLTGSGQQARYQVALEGTLEDPASYQFGPLEEAQRLAWTFDGLLTPPKPVPASPVRLPTPFLAFGPPPAGAIHGLSLYNGKTLQWRVFAIDGRTRITVPPRPAAAACINRFEQVDAFVCRDFSYDLGICPGMAFSRALTLE